MRMKVSAIELFVGWPWADDNLVGGFCPPVVSDSNTSPHKCRIGSCKSSTLNLKERVDADVPGPKPQW